MAEGGSETGPPSVSDAESGDSDEDLGETIRSADPTKVLTQDDPDTGSDVSVMASSSLQPNSGEVLYTEQRHFQVEPCPSLPLAQPSVDMGDATQTASGKVDMKVEGNSGVVKGIEQHVYQGCTFYKYEILASSPGDLQALTQGVASPFLQMSPSVDLPGLSPPSVPSLPPPSVPSLPPPSVQPALPLPPPPAPLPQAPPTTELQPQQQSSQQQSSQQQSSQQQSSQQQPSQQQSSQQQSSQQQSSQQQSSQQQSSQQQSSQQQSSQQQPSQQPPSQQQPSPPTSSPPPPQTASMARDEGGAPGRQSTESQTAAPPSPPPSVPPAASPHLPEESKKLKNLIANTEQYIATACPQGYVETLALGELEEELEDSGVCLVLGLPGHGKTALALQAMGRLAASQQFKPVRLTKPEQWEWLPGEGKESKNAGRQHRKHPHPDRETQSKARSEISQSSGTTACCSDQPSQKKEVQDSRRYVVLLDDVFGKGHYNAAKKKAWEEVFDLVLAKVKAKQVKVILVSRVHIYEECKKSLSGLQLFDDVKTVDLRKSEYWTESDKEAILENFLQEKDVRVNKPIIKFIRASRSCTHIGFPQVCRFFASEKLARLQGPNFFSKPLQFLHKLFEQMQENDIRSYLILILTWLEGGILSGEFLSIHNTNSKKRISDLCEQFDVKDVMTIREVQTKARSLCGVYLSEDEEGSFRFTHQTICDSLVVAMCSFNLKRALDVCSIRQVCAYIRTKDRAIDQSGLTYRVPKSKWPLLAARLVRAMRSERLRVALDHPSLRDGEFVSLLVDKHLTVSHTAQILQRECKVQMNFAVHLPSDDFLNYPEEMLFLFRLCFHDVEVMTTTSVASFLISTQSALANHFLKKNVLRSLPEAEVSKHLREALQAACYVSNEALVTDLLERRAEVTLDTFLATCKSKRDDVTTLRKVTEKLSREQLDIFGHKKLLWICCVRSKVECLKFLLSEFRLKERQRTLDHVLSELVRVSHPSFRDRSHCFERLSELLSALKTAGARLDKTRVDLQFAAGHPSAFALREHLAGDTSQPSTVFSYGSTLLHQAAGFGSLECLSLLMESTATTNLNVNALDQTNQTPLCRAVAGNQVKALEFLLKHGADPNIGSVRVTDSSSHPPLLAAAARRQFSAMKLLLQHNASTDVTDERKRTPLHIYVRGTREFAVDEPEQVQQHCEDLLIAKTPNINQKDNDGSTPLHLACEASQTYLVQKLLSQRARVDVVDNRGRTVLHTLANGAPYEKGRNDADGMVGMIIERYNNYHARRDEEPREESSLSTQDWMSSTDEEGRTPLHWAAERGNLAVVKALLKHKVKTEIQDGQGWTPLHFAASQCHIAVMDELTARGARIDAEDKQKRVPLHIFAERLSKATDRRSSKHLNPELKVVLNRQNAQGQTALHIASGRGVHSFVWSLLKAGAKADLMDGDGRFPLHCLAAWKEEKGEENDEELRTKTEKELVSATPDVNVQDKHGKTPLHLVAESGNYSLSSTLLDKGARTGITDPYLRLPLHCLAARWTVINLDGEIRTLTEKKLVDATLDVNAQDKNGMTPLHLAAKYGSLFLIQFLLDKGARTDTKDDNHHLPLHCLAARFTGNWEDKEIKPLAEKMLAGAIPVVNIQDKNDQTPLHLAAGSASLCLIQFLLDKGARTDIKDNDHRLPLHCMAAQLRGLWEDKKMAGRRLVSATSDVNAQDRHGKTPLHLVAESGNYCLISILLEYGARTDTTDHAHCLPLHCMAARTTKPWEQKRLRSLAEKELVSATRDVNVQDRHGQTPLHLAAEHGSLFVITTLLDRGARTDITDADHRLPLHCMAARMQNSDEDEDMRVAAEERLVSSTPDINVQDKCGMTPLHLAEELCNFSLEHALQKSIQGQT